MKRFGQFLREQDAPCNCPPGWTVFATFENWCICLDPKGEGVESDEDENDCDDESDEDCADEGEIDEALIPTGKLGRDLEFPLLELEDLVRVRVSKEGMWIKVGRGNFFRVPEVEEGSIWEVLEDRLR
jgi:hypothetical protein